MEEFELALSRRRSGSPSPEIMVYFKDSPISPTKIDPNQLLKIQEFRAELPEIGALYAEFSDESGFETALRAHLAAVARKFSRQSKNELAKSEAEADIVEEDDDDFGYLDYIESYEARMSDMIGTLSSITSATTRMGDDFNHRSAEVRSFTESDNRSDVKAAKRIIKRAADDMNAYEISKLNCLFSQWREMDL